PNEHVDHRVAAVGTSARQATPEEVGHHVECVEAGRHHDVELDLLGDASDPGYVPAQAQGGGVDDGVDAGLLELGQSTDGVGDAYVLVAPHLWIVLQDLG